MTTVLGIMPVANIAHGVGALVGWLLGHAIVSRDTRRLIASGSLALLTVLCFGLASVGREYVNVTGEVSLEYWQRGVDALQKGDNEAAVTHFRKALAIKKDEASLWFNLGIAYQGLNQQEQALEAYQQAWDLGKHDEGTRELLVKQYAYLSHKALAARDWPKAEHFYRALLSVDDRSAENWYKLALAHKNQGKIKEAIQALQNAVSKSPDTTYRELLESLKEEAKKAVK